ncbi:MAG: DJ-1/PfpI family protein [Thalassolituus sp.]
MLQHISVLTLDKMLISSLAMPLEMLEAAISYRTLKQRKRPLIQVTSLATGDVCRPVGGLSLQPGQPLESVQRTDLIMIPALWRNPLHHKPLSDELSAWLCARHDEGARIMAIGTGVWLLGQAGLLKGHDATTHWHALDDFEADFPLVRLQRDHLLTQSGRIYCAASINSGADLMIHMIGTFFDAETARFVEQQFSPEARMSYDKRVFTEGCISIGRNHST